MKINQKGVDLIKSFEGLRLSPYKDPVGIETIGIGATFYPDGKKVSMSDKPITEKQAIDLLLWHISKYEEAVTSMVTVTLTSNQFSALVSFTYNCGPNNLKTSSLLKKLNQSLYREAAEEFLKWNKSRGKVFLGLTKRRQAEKALFLEPDQDAKGNLLPNGPTESDMKSILEGIEKSLLGK